MSTSSSWNHAPFSLDVLCKGDGLVVDGVVVAIRVHSVFVSGEATKNVANQDRNLPVRYQVATIELTNAHKRAFQPNGLELNYKANTPDSRKYVPLTAIEADALARLLGSTTTGAALPDKFFDDGVANVHPAAPRRFDLFVDASAPGAKDIEKGQTYRFLTRGASVFVERHESLSGTANIFKGGAAKDLSHSWTTGVANAAASSGGSGKPAHEDKEGVADEEWDD
jgi:hypothetical protein